MPGVRDGAEAGDEWMQLKKGSTGHLCGDGIVLSLDFAGSTPEIQWCRTKCRPGEMDVVMATQHEGI